jgi:predicted nucleotidyltransferase
VLSPGEIAILASLKAALQKRFGARLLELVLFGSRARGGGRDDSDLDVLVGIDKLTREERHAILDLAADLSLHHELVLSPLVLDPGLVSPDSAGARGVHACALREGIPL